ncbi:MAG: hypothetical protein LBQ64_06960 [Bacteroidales bacterium]|jgi:hypothetical protein|nr:hypothetical protein [Bacteroidales bacterium]
MKKLIFAAIAAVMVIGGIIFYACQKESTELDSTKMLNSVTDNGLIQKEMGGTICISWVTGKGKPCEGKKGMCNFRISIEHKGIADPISSIANFAVVEKSDKGDLFVKILANKESFSDGNTFFPIDEDRYSRTEDGDLYMIPKGDYPLHPELGDLGGYIIPVFLVK